MALAVALLGATTFNTTAGNKTVVATPTLGDMIVIVAAATGPTGATVSVSDNNSDGHGTYEVIVSSVKNASADPMIAFVRSDPIRSATSTTFTSVQTSSTGGGLAVFRVTGATLCGPVFIRQSGKQDNQAAGGTPADALGIGAALTGNALIAAVFNAAAAAPGLTSPTGFAAAPGDVNANYSTPSAGLAITHANSGVTASTITWGSSSATAFCSLAFEMAADAGQTALFPPRGGEAVDISFSDSPKMQAVKRSAFFMLGDKWARRGALWVPRREIALPVGV